MMNIDLLKVLAKEITASGLPFMEGKEAIEDKGVILNNTLTVDDYGFLEGEDGEYVVIAIKEYPQNFIFGGSIVTEAFKKLESKVSEEGIKELIDYGLTFKLEESISKNKRKYTKITFFPEN